MNDLTLIIPSKKESESLPIFLKELEIYNFKKLVVLEKNDIETKESILNVKNIEILEQKKIGYGNALIEGINATTTNFCCIINADGSMDPKYLHEMLNRCQNTDFVFTSRYSNGGGSDDDNIITYIGNKLFSLIGKIFFNLKISDILFTYILGKTEKFKDLNLKFGDFRICVELPICIKKKKF
tara:strand:- start:31 stop:579 length:549 start_codon:yes stop_codon:yes gene_type:complete